MEEKDRLSNSPSQERDSTSSEDDSPIIGEYNGMLICESIIPLRVQQNQFFALKFVK